MQAVLFAAVFCAGIVLGVILEQARILDGGDPKLPLFRRTRKP
jgi:hypothetical protein